MEENIVENSHKRLEKLCKGELSHELEAVTLKGLEIITSRKGYYLCRFVVPDNLLDEDGNWHVGAIAVLMDDVCAAAVNSSTGHIKASVDFTISYFSTAKSQEEVEIEAKVLANQGKLTSVMIEIKRKSNGGLIALGKQWMTTTSIKRSEHQISKL
ncbi:hypothetical protein UlMin_018170 [Ulmus minor]